jgi:hypothetical protein
MEPFAKRVRSEEEVAREHAGGPREDYRAPGAHDSFAFGIDPSCCLAWESSDIEGDRVVAILSERVSDEYLAFLRERGVSYVFAGERELDWCWRSIRSAPSSAFDEALYGGPGFITHSYPWFLPKLPTLTLVEAREQTGIE